MKRMPLFLTNDDWYTVDRDDEERRYKLTDRAPQEAIDSYNEFYDDAAILGGDAKRAFLGYEFD